MRTNFLLKRPNCVQFLSFLFGSVGSVSVGSISAGTSGRGDVETRRVGGATSVSVERSRYKIKERRSENTVYLRPAFLTLSLSFS
jgi:hypothetical protein